MTDINNLITRLEAAERGGTELSAEMAVRLRFPEYKYPKPVLNRRPDSWREAWTRLTHDGFGGGADWPHYTTSLDAITALIEEKLPGWEWDVHSNLGAVVYDPIVSSGVTYKSTENSDVVQTAPLALCIAFLRAYEAQEGD